MTPFIGQIQAFGFNFAPRGWTLCNGQLLAISSYTAVFSLLGTTFGGDGRTTFGIPELRGRSIVGVGSGPGLSFINWGQPGGVEQVQLTLSHLPNHTHILPATTANAVFGANSESGGSIGNDISSSATNADGADHNVTGTVNIPQQTTLAAGGSQPFFNRNPFLGIYYSIALEMKDRSPQPFEKTVDHGCMMFRYLSGL